jgi:ParB/RepB/Spo0J family partition protein
MTATAPVVADVQVREIPIDDLFVSPDNPRKTFDQTQLEELAATIRKGGILVPLSVRPQMYRFEIVCGQRRYAAGKIAGLVTLPCIVRKMTDAEAAELALVDNLQRADVPPLEEARAFEALLKQLGSIEAVAARVGKEVSHVARQLKLCSLGLAPCDALREKLITVDHALLLARLGLDEQDQALKWVIDPQAGVKKSVSDVIDARIAARAKWEEEGKNWRAWEPESVLRLKEHIQGGAGPELSRAPWSLGDFDLLPELGSCLDCPKNTKVNAPLFADLEIGEPTCTDGGCFKQKTEEFVRLEAHYEANRAAQKAGQPPVPGAFEPLRASWKPTSSEPRKTKVKTDTLGQPTKGSIVINLAQDFKAGQWVEAKKHCEHARAAVTVDWSDNANRGYMGRNEKLRKPGEILQVCVVSGCKAHPKAWEKAKSEGGARRDPAAEKAAEEKRAAEARAESKLRVAVASKALESITAIPADVLRVLVIAIAPNYGDALKLSEAALPGFTKTLKTAKVDSVEFAKAVALVSLDNISANEYQGTKYGRDKFLASVKRLGFDGAYAWKTSRASKSTKKSAVKKTVKAAKKEATPAKRTLSAEQKKRIKDAVKRRWAGQGVHAPATKLQVTLTDDEPDGGDS